MKKSHRKALAGFEVELKRSTLVGSVQVSYLRNTRRFLKGLEGRLSDLSRREVETHLALLQSLGLAPSSRHYTLCALRAFSRFLVEQGIRSEDPTRGITVRVPRTEALLLTQASVKELLACASDVPESSRRWPQALRDRAFLELTYACALRRSEALGVRLVDLDLDVGTLFVRRVKGSRPGELPITPSALAWVRRYASEGRPRLLRGPDPGRLFLSRLGKPPRLAWANEMLSKIGARAGIRVHPHALRRACASHLVEQGASLRVVQLVLGHASLGVTARYVGVSREALRRAVELLPASS